MKMTDGEYGKYVAEHAPRSKSGRNMLRAFVSGGAICALGQLLLIGYARLGLTREDAATAVSVTLILLGAALTALGVYDDLARFAGAGTLVPITGFANSVAAPALEFRTEGYITGTAAKMFVIAGPVLVFGSSASVLVGLIEWLLGLL